MSLQGDTLHFLIGNEWSTMSNIVDFAKARMARWTAEETPLPQVTRNQIDRVLSTLNISEMLVISIRMKKGK